MSSHSSSLTNSRSPSLNSNSSILTNDRSDDEDFNIQRNKITSVHNRKATPGIVSKRGGGARGRPIVGTGRTRRTVKTLTESGLLNHNDLIKFKAFNEYREDDDGTAVNVMHNYDDRHLTKSNPLLVNHRTNNDSDEDDESESDDHTDSDSDNDLRTLNLKKLNNSTKLFRRLTNISDSNSPPNNNTPQSSNSTASGTQMPKQLTFEQYVKKLTGSTTLQQQQQQLTQPTQLPQPSAAPSTTQQTAVNRSTLLSTSLKPIVSTTSTKTTKVPLNIPIINPDIKAALSKYNSAVQLQSSSNSTNTNTTAVSVNLASQSVSSAVKLFTVPISSQITSSTAATTTTTITTATPITSINSSNSSSKFIILNSTNDSAATSTTSTVAVSNQTSNNQLVKIVNGISLKQITTIPQHHQPQQHLTIKTNGIHHQITTTSISPKLNKQILMINKQVTTASSQSSSSSTTSSNIITATASSAPSLTNSLTNPTSTPN